jgi:lipid II:glycine glycyltransferase (peptidoglycan interpeptide bridge formation enzyme)
VLRAFGEEPYCTASLRDFTDITSPYGYGGPFRWGEPWDRCALKRFWGEFDTWAVKSRVVSEVVRFSLFPESLVEYAGDRHVVSDNVVCVLKGNEELWRGFEHKVRKNVTRARTSGVTVQVDLTGERLDEFLSIYAATMGRRSAKESYYFPREYFERLHIGLKGQFAYFHACVGGAVVSTELVLVSSRRVYSFLGGTDAAWFHVRPNELLKLEIMNWARASGKTEFVLGGGYTPGDGIYRYKRSFAPHGSVPFSIGSRIFDVEAYHQMIDSRRAFAATQAVTWSPHPQYFPAYRG